MPLRRTPLFLITIALTSGLLGAHAQEQATTMPVLGSAAAAPVSAYSVPSVYPRTLLSGEARSARLEKLLERWVSAGPSGVVGKWPAPRDRMKRGVHVNLAGSAGKSTLSRAVFSVSGAATYPSRSDAPRQIEPQVTSADGGNATVRISAQGSGGTFEYRMTDLATLFTDALPTTVNAPPEFAN